MRVTYQATDTVNVDEISYKQHGAAHVFLFIEGFRVFKQLIMMYYHVLCCTVGLSIILFTFGPINVILPGDQIAII